jgi:oligopeptidase B
MAQGSNFYQVSDIYVSPNNNLVAFGVDTIGRRKYTIHFKMLDAGKILDDAIPNTTGEVAWANDNKTIFYALKDDTLRPYKIMKHGLGKPIREDNEIFYESDNTYNLSVFNSRSKKYIFMSLATYPQNIKSIPVSRMGNSYYSAQGKNLDYKWTI